jgi:hypothetical protein
MEEGQDMSSSDMGNAGEIVAGTEAPTEMAEGSDSGAEGNETRGDSLSVQKRLKAQKRSHDREMREMQSRMDAMQSQFQQAGNPQQQNPYDGGSMGNSNGSDGMQDAIHKAVTYALQQKEMEERRARESEAQQHIAKQYADLNRHLDSTADKYDDFDDIVRGDTPFTATMRDTSLMLPKKGPGSAGEVLYRLGKNPEELSRIGKLHPVDQAAELVALSHALISGGEQGRSNAPSRPLGQIKSNPVVNAAGITDKTPVSELRNRMKEGKFR